MKYIFLIISTMFIFTACSQPQLQQVTKKPVVAKVDHKNPTHNSQSSIHKKPKKEIELKEVEDKNFSSEYMYPSANKQKDKSKKVIKKKEDTPALKNELIKEQTADTPKLEEVKIDKKTSAASLTKADCITMIGQEKFDQYAELYGSEDAPMKKCKMLKKL